MGKNNQIWLPCSIKWFSLELDRFHTEYFCMFPDFLIAKFSFSLFWKFVFKRYSTSRQCNKSLENLIILALDISLFWQKLQDPKRGRKKFEITSGEQCQNAYTLLNFRGHKILNWKKLRETGQPHSEKL